MTLSRKLGAFVLPSAAISLSVFGLSMGTAAEPEPGAAETLPMQCQISITKDRYGHTYAGVLSALQTVSGTYELSLSKRGGGNTVIRQSGEFLVSAGQTETLGQAMFGGVLPENVEAELKLHVGGKTYVCGSQAEI